MSAALSDPQRGTRSSVSSSKDSISDEAYCYALEQLLNGSKPHDVRRSLLDAGYNVHEVDQIIQTACNYRKEHQQAVTVQAEEHNRATLGVIALVLGGTITIGSFLMSGLSQSNQE